ncbi:uncharacterized protein E0L32_001010 [Thyridium curvatum]|uniref:Hemerythrin-like domain-containing protein n=1 Tax=Thyridium curvatum TaxID=1093900 RepID=A0A507AMU2_9PEZI|nr:uncharacterized protein E0L32_001010 [Thyridium curvatum]TPX11192.1 hypothetical protein E0L32_001010 [Thyridium curvatum]
MASTTTPVPADDPAKEAAAEAGGEGAKKTAAEAETPAPLPPLSPREFREYNHLADQMNAYHNHFRHTWTMLYTACTENRRPQGMSLRQFIDQGLYFVRGLTMHHNIEETYFFPQLAKRMPEFQAGKGKGKGGGKGGGGGMAELLQQHRQIHAGMDVFEEYLTQCRRGERELEMATLKAKMDSWGDVLWTHLDQEVKTLGAENMRKYWTKEEIFALTP